MTPEQLSCLRNVGPFPSLQVAPSRPTGDELNELLSNPVDPAAPIGALTYHGGPTLAQPKLVALYAGSFYGDRAKNDQFLKEIMEYGYLAKLTGQGFGSGRFLGSFTIPAPAAHVTDTDCQALIAAALAADGAIPRPDPETIYMLILPDGVSVGDGTPANSSCTGFCGYHSATAEFLYTIQPATTCNTCNQGDAEVGLQMVEAHEVAETCSDPHGSGWYSDQTGMENADECAWVQRPFGPWTVQGYAAQDASGAWVNAVGDYTVPAQPQPEPQPQPQPTPERDGPPPLVPDGFDATLPIDTWLAAHAPALFTTLAAALSADKAAVLLTWETKMRSGQVASVTQWAETLPLWAWIDAQPETAGVLAQLARADPSGNLAGWLAWMESKGYLTAASAG
jgi:hypothetical protein